MKDSKVIIRHISLWLLIIGLVYCCIWYVPWISASMKEKSLTSKADDLDRQYHQSGLNVFNGGLSQLEEIGAVRGKAQDYRNKLDDKKHDKLHGILSVAIFVIGLIGISTARKL